MAPQLQVVVEPFSPLPAPTRTPGRRVSPNRSSASASSFATRYVTRRGSNASGPASSAFSSSINVGTLSTGRITRAGAKHPLSFAASRQTASTPTTSDPLSPLRRSAGILHLDQASLGSPVSKRHFRHPSDVPVDDFASPDKFQAPPTPVHCQQLKKPQSSLSPTHLHSTGTDELTAANYVSSGQPFSTPVHHNESAAAAIFANGKLGIGIGNKTSELGSPRPDNQLFQVRRTISVENFLSAGARDSPFSSTAPLPNPSVHPHPLSQSHTISSLSSDDELQLQLSQKGFNKTANPKKKRQSLASIPMSVSWSSLSRAVSNNSSSSFETPQNYRLVKPFQPAFMSTGLLSKRNRPSNGSTELSHLAPPDTPCKRPAQPQFSATSPSFKPSVSTFSSSSGDVEEIFNLGGSNAEYEMPPTPTKAFGSAHSDSLQNRSVPQAWTIPSTTPVDPQFPSVSPTAGSLLDLKTPTTPAKPIIGYFDPSLTPSSSLDTFLLNKFRDVSSIGTGEFSAVYLVTERDNSHNKYAVKRTKAPLAGQKSLDRRLEEVAILKDLCSRTEDNDREYIINYIDSWEFQGHLYIMTEYCENGNLDVFLAEYGSLSKLDEWRVWKILVEIAFGLRFIHDAGYIHLDLKPANVFITFEGSLKIGDFGMATKLPVTKGIEREGDREYIAPEVLALQEYSKPADIFSFGLVMLEIAANIVLPDNGAPWHKLRSGDLSDAGRLSSSSGDLKNMNKADGTKVPPWAPDFMLDEAGALDKFVKWMLKPTPSERPTIHDILQTEEARTVESRRRSGAIIFEGEYGPEPDDLQKAGKDASMLDQDEDWRMEL